MRQLKLILRLVAAVTCVLALFMIICGCAAVALDEQDSAEGFFTSAFIIILSDLIIFYISRYAKKAEFSIRSGFFLVSFIWISVSFLGTMPYIFSGAITDFADALFESVSGFTTVGASILTRIEYMPDSILLWRGITHWIGGCGIIVLSVAVLPLLGINGMQLMKAETSGLKVDKLSPRIAETAKLLLFLYLALTILCFSFLIYGGMGIIDALCHAFSAVSTGGLSSRTESVGYFNSAYIDWVIVAFMFLSSINFVLLIRLIRGQFSYLRIDSEFKTFFLFTIIISASVSAINYYNGIYDNWEDSIRFSTFQIVSIFSTTGFSTADYELWPASVQGIIFILFFVGGCSGSTSGGMKVIRYVILLKQLARELKNLLKPRGVFIFHINKESASDELVHSVASYFFVYMLSILGLTFAVSSCGVNILNAFPAVLGTFTTVGPCFGDVGPAENYSHFPDIVKYILCFAMMLGRLEIYTLLLIFTPWFWKR